MEITDAELAVKCAEERVYAELLAKIYKCKYNGRSDTEIIELLTTELEAKKNTY
ncbi:MAG: hypothetical protein IJ737_01980 [Ruminococcus sp.]|nr:hypothetical protein [Ruminococcus sp.]